MASNINTFRILSRTLLLIGFLLVSGISFSQTHFEITLKNAKGNPVSDAAIYVLINNDKAFIGFSNSSGFFQRALPDQNKGVIISCLGYKDKTIMDLSINRITLETDSIQLVEFVVCGGSSSTELDKFELIEQSVLKSQIEYGRFPKVYRIEVFDILHNSRTNSLNYFTKGFYLEMPYSPKKKKSNRLKDKWTLDWDIYSNDTINSVYYSEKFFPFVTYGFASLFQPNPLNTKNTTLGKDDLNDQFRLYEFQSNNDTIGYKLNSKIDNSVWVCMISSDSILLELESFHPDTLILKLPPNSIKRVGFGGFKTKRTWRFVDGNYSISSFSFSGYYFVEYEDSVTQEFIIYEKILFTENENIITEFKDIGVSITPSSH